MMSKICIPVPLLLLLLPAVCEGSIHLRKFGQHHHASSWKVAQAHCRRRHTDLVTIRSSEENKNFFGGSGWFGLYRENSTSPWKWSRREEKANFTNWHHKPGIGENCVYKLRNTYEWRSDSCETKRVYMCQEETQVLVKELKTWEEALEHCRALEALDPSKPATAYQNHSYDLASLLTADDHTEAQEMMRYQASTDQAWTGLRYLAGQWLWVGGEEVQYHDLDTCPSVRFCGVLNKNNNPLIDTRDCSLKRNFLCYRKP